MKQQIDKHALAIHTIGRYSFGNEALSDDFCRWALAIFKA